jgi:hypothetical protein
MRRITGILLLSGLAASSAFAGEPTTVVGDRVNVRGKPTVRSEVITQLRDGETVVFLREITPSNPAPGEPARWAQIELPENTPVWISAKYVDPVTRTINADRLNVRSGQSLNHSVIGQVMRGQAVKEIRTVGEWMEIETPKGAFAYVSASYLAKTASSAAPVTTVGQQEDPPKAAPGAPAIKPPVAPSKPADNRARTLIVGPLAPDSSDSVMARAKAIIAPRSRIIAPSKPTVAAPAEPSVALAKPETPSIKIAPLAPSEPAASKPGSEPIMIVDASASTPAVQVSPGQVPPELILTKSATHPVVPVQPVSVQPASVNPSIQSFPVGVSTNLTELSQPKIKDSVRGLSEIVIVPAPPVSTTAEFPRRIVTRRGVVRRAFSIVAPTSHALIDSNTGRLINYLYPGETELQLKYYAGKKIEVSGRESLDKRWPRTPLIEIQTLKPLN